MHNWKTSRATDTRWPPRRYAKRPAQLALAVALAAAAIHPAFAFERCSAPLAAESAFGRDMGRAAIRRSPVKYNEIARGITLVTAAPGESLIPLAGEQQGTKFVLLTPLFAKVTCEVVLAQYIAIDVGDDAPLDQAARLAAQCLDQGGSTKKCLSGFGTDLARLYAKPWAALPAEHRELAYSVYHAALYQILMHEYAHHFLNHPARIRAQKVARIDAEFDADLFAIMNGVESGEAPSAMHYFFNGLARIEQQTKKSTAPEYESGACRAANVANVTGVFGIMPMLLLDAAFGGGMFSERTSAAQVRANGEELFGGERPTLAVSSCDRITGVALGTAFDELKLLYARMARDLDFLFATDKQVDTVRANRLLRDLSAMTGTLQYLDGIAAKSIGLMLRGWELKGRQLSPLMQEIDRLLTVPGGTDDFLSEDLGRILQAQGLAILQERTDLSAPVRLERSFSLLQRAVYYNPDQSESWMNLASVAFKRGDCKAAAQFGGHALETLTEEKEREGTQFFVLRMKELSSSTEACRKEAADFGLYPGL